MAGPVGYYSNNNTQSAPAPIVNNMSSPVITQPNLVVRGAPAGYDIAPGSTLSGNHSYGSAAVPVTTNVNAKELANTQPLKLPTPPIPTNQNGTILGANAGLANTQFGLSTDANGNLQYNAPQVEERTKEEGGSLADSLKGYLQNLANNRPPSAEAMYNALPQKAQFEQASRDVANYAGQINAIVAKSQADQLAVVGQGRGIPEAIIGGQQAKISREAAIKALPLQALLANAQANKELAQQHLDTVFQLRMEDARSQFEYKNKVFDVVYQAATKAEERRLDDLRHQNDQNFQRVSDAINYTQQLSAKALENNDARAAARLAQIKQPDPASKTFMQDLATYNAEVGRVQSTMKPDAIRELNIANLRSNLETDRLNRANIQSQIGQRNTEIEISKAELELKKKEALTGKPATAEEKIAAQANTELMNLLGQYRDKVAGTNWFTANLPGNKATLSTLKGQITAEYKKAEKLGTLDAGVQKLIDSIVPTPGGFNVTSMSKKAQLAAIDNFISNQGGSTASPQNTLDDETAYAEYLRIINKK